MTLGSAVVYYAVRVVIFSVVAGVGIALGIKLRKSKNAKEANTSEN